MNFFKVGDDGIIRDRDRCPPHGPKSLHCEGRAWDAKVTAPSPVGDELANWAVSVADVLGIQEVIWNHRAWAYWNSYSWGPYSGPSPHTDHVHIGLNKKASQALTEALVRMYLPLGKKGPTMIVLVGPDGRAYFANPEVKRGFGNTADLAALEASGIPVARVSQGFLDLIPDVEA